MDRPHILYCPQTGKYVAWLKIMCEGNNQCMSVLQADDFLGPYEFVHRLYRPLAMSTGDFDLYSDPETGKGYFIFDRPHFEIITAELTDDYTAVTDRYSAHCFTDGSSGAGREAPTHFVRGGKHYLITSGTTWYYPNPSRVDRFGDFHGEYEELGNPCVGEDDYISFGGQFTEVLQVPGSDLYIAMADRWVLDQERVQQIGKSLPMAAKIRPKQPIDREPKGEPVLPSEERTFDDDTSISRYIWLPIEWDGDRPVIRWRDEWCVEDFTEPGEAGH
ncbi:MAG: family 43 glycosylhydrolase [Eubacteriales bacterium]|nr:family 43 glycosylhydrolase [Eubacteriales bacterium]